MSKKLSMQPKLKSTYQQRCSVTPWNGYIYYENIVQLYHKLKFMYIPPRGCRQKSGRFRLSQLSHYVGAYFDNFAFECRPWSCEFEVLKFLLEMRWNTNEEMHKQPWKHFCSNLMRVATKTAGLTRSYLHAFVAEQLQVKHPNWCNESYGGCFQCSHLVSPFQICTHHGDRNEPTWSCSPPRWRNVGRVGNADFVEIPGILDKWLPCCLLHLPWATVRLRLLAAFASLPPSWRSFPSGWSPSLTCAASPHFPAPPLLHKATGEGRYQCTLRGAGLPLSLLRLALEVLMPLLWPPPFVNQNPQDFNSPGPLETSQELLHFSEEKTVSRLVHS